MKRNKQFYKEKEILRLRNRISEIREEQQSLGYVELETPHFIGYEAYLIPREDIRNRVDGQVFFEVSSVCTKPTAKAINKFSWNRKVWKHTWNQEKPSLNRINPNLIKTLSDKAKRFFAKVEVDRAWGKGVYYTCTLPNWYFEIAYRKRFRTKLKVESTKLESELQECKKALDILTDTTWGYSYGAYYKWFRRFQNKKQRQLSKRLERDADFANVEHYKGASYYM